MGWTARSVTAWRIGLGVLAILAAPALLGGPVGPARADLGLLEETRGGGPAAEQTKTGSGAAGQEASAATSQPDAEHAPNRAAGQTDKDQAVRFSKPTPEEAKAALEDARAKALETVRRLRLNLALVETPHFLIFTNWPQSERQWAAVTFEQMYRGLARQFALDPSENIWYGKLPVYALESAQDLARFARQIDQIPDDVSRIAGYAFVQTDGRGHIVLRRYGGRDQLASTIVHEGTHAFVARYRTNLIVPSWLNEGLAQMMEQIGVPGSTKLASARAASLGVASRAVDIRAMFNDDDNITAEMYPVSMTVVDLLIRRDRAAFVAMINDIKDGMEVEAALKKNYEWTYTDLARWWYKWARMNFR